VRQVGNAVRLVRDTNVVIVAVRSDSGASRRLLVAGCNDGASYSYRYRWPAGSEEFGI